jgi:hypothetical protein
MLPQANKQVSESPNYLVSLVQCLALRGTAPEKEIRGWLRHPRTPA